MAKKEPIIIKGQTVGKMKASWILFKESWRYLKADKEMVWIPLITSAINLALFGVLIALFVLAVLGGDFSLSSEGESSSPIELLFMFLCYILAAFTLVLSQGAITHTVYVRIHGGDATLGQALKSSFSNWSTFLVWSVITSTVGILLRMIAERSKLLGSIAVWILGTAWSVMTYFVVSAIMIDKESAFGSIKKSGQVFKATWGETLVSNFSLGLTFLILHIVALLSLIGLIILGNFVGLEALTFVVFGLYFVWLVISVLVQSTLEAIIKTLLYVYATEETTLPNFNQELLEKMLSRPESK